MDTVAVEEIDASTPLDYQLLTHQVAGALGGNEDVQIGYAEADGRLTITVRSTGGTCDLAAILAAHEA